MLVEESKTTVLEETVTKAVETNARGGGVKLVSAAATRVRLSFKGTCVGTLVFLL